MEKADARGFVADLNRTYGTKTELKRLCSHGYYDGENRDFFQIGRRVTVPTGLVEEGRYRYVSDGVVDAVCEGEKTFVADRLDAVADDGGFPTVEAEGVEEGRDAVEEGDTVLLPRDEGGDAKVSEWEDEGRLRSIGEDEYLDGDDEGYWLRRHDGGSAFVVASERVGVVQKKGGDTDPPDFSRVEAYDEISDEMDVDVYFGDEEDGYVELVYRVVVSEPVVDDSGACRLSL
ncbi:MAG: hypothetical protein ACI9QA_000618 [Methanobacteriota archaeon]|jgi:hypothetical protein|uniref:Uncharacterized protein n=1 Tax=Halorutilus salinus TaxID=2487751 RepID=A0A9Q4GJ68_9EURY|nr:hypothetical protein [Halorutilus salinus]MCX2818946.1 hypothetical protein [Halorutilus salinus]